MKHISSRVAAFTALYILVIFTIFALQFTKGETFSSKLGVMTVSGRYESDDTGKKIPLLPLYIVSNGLNFYISGQNLLKAFTSEGDYLPLKVLSYETEGNSFTIHCSEGISVSFSSDVRGDKDFLMISADFPENIDSVFFPWKLTRSARLERRSGRIFLQYGKRKFVFSGGSGFKDSEEKLKRIKAEVPHLFLSKENPSVYYHTYIEEKGIVLEKLAENPLSSEKEYLENISVFAEKALYSFKKAILSKNHSEKILTAYIAEMGRKGFYNAALKEAPPAILPKSGKTYLSAPFYGNIVEAYEGLLAEEMEKRAFLTREIPAKNYEVFNFKKLLPYLLDRDSGVLINDLLLIAENPDFSKIDAEKAACILELSMDYSQIFPNRKNVFEKLTDTCERKIKEKLLFIDSGLFLSQDSRHIDTLQSLYVSEVLIRYGKEKNPLWKSAGRMLFNSLFMLAGESASLPAFFKIETNAQEEKGLMADDSEILYPETLYVKIPFEGARYPHEISLVKEYKDGCWAWSAAEDIRVTENTAYKLSFEVKFDKGEFHYLVFRGIPNFERIRMHDMDFKTDPRFEIYNSSGYVYNPAAKVLYLKLKHTKERESIELFLK